MGERLTPINDIIKRAKELAKKPKKNKQELEELIVLINYQLTKINKLNEKEIDDFLINNDESNPKYIQKLNLKKEKEEYIKNSAVIKQIIKKQYKELTKREKGNKKKLAVLFASGVLAATLATFGIINNNKNNNNKNVPKSTTENTLNNSSNVIIVKKPTTERTTIVPTSEATRNDTTKTTTEVTTAETTSEPTTKVTTTETTSTETTTELTTTEDTTEDTTEKYSDAEQNTVLEIFRTMKNDIIELYNSNEAKLAREKGKEYVVATIDFLFFNASINGMTFKDLRSDVKEELYEILQGMDAVVSYFDPDYKEELGEKYNAVKYFASEKYDQAKELIINKIGQEKYDKIISEKNEILDKILDTFKKYGGKILDFIKDKYDIWKNKTR